MNVRSSSARSLRATIEAQRPATGPLAGAADLTGRTETVTAVAAANADAVDREARFPHEAIAAARSQRLLGIMVPHELGGEGAALSDVVDVCYRLRPPRRPTAHVLPVTPPPT